MSPLPARSSTGEWTRAPVQQGLNARRRSAEDARASVAAAERSASPRWRRPAAFSSGGTRQRARTIPQTPPAGHCAGVRDKELVARASLMHNVGDEHFRLRARAVALFQQNVLGRTRDLCYHGTRTVGSEDLLAVRWQAEGELLLVCCHVAQLEGVILSGRVGPIVLHGEEVCCWLPGAGALLYLPEAEANVCGTHPSVAYARTLRVLHRVPVVAWSVDVMRPAELHAGLLRELAEPRVALGHRIDSAWRRFRASNCLASYEEFRRAARLLRVRVQHARALQRRGSLVDEHEDVNARGGEQWRTACAGGRRARF